MIKLKFLGGASLALVLYSTGCNAQSPIAPAPVTQTLAKSKAGKVRLAAASTEKAVPVGVGANDVPVVKTLHVYFVGNSVTDTLNYQGLEDLANTRGTTQIWGRHMIPGAPLEWIWAHPESGFQNEEFGFYAKALPDFKWDAVSLQPFDRHLEDDVRDVQKFIDLTLKNPANANTQFYIYARWPRMSREGKGVEYDKNNFGKDDDDPNKITDYTSLDDWQKLWTAKYTGGWDNTNEGANYFERLTQAVRAGNPKLQKPVLMVPVGHVMAALDEKMRAGKVPGHNSIWDVYADGIHFNKIGSYLVACTFYATLYRQSPQGLTGEPYHMTDSKLNRIIQDTAWEVVSRHPLAGVAASPLPAP